MKLGERRTAARAGTPVAGQPRDRRTNRCARGAPGTAPASAQCSNRGDYRVGARRSSFGGPNQIRREQAALHRPAQSI